MYNRAWKIIVDTANFFTDLIAEENIHGESINAQCSF